jgi:hypothetical protein
MKRQSRHYVRSQEGLGSLHVQFALLGKTLRLHAQPPARLHSVSKANPAISCRLFLYINCMKGNTKFQVELSAAHGTMCRKLPLHFSYDAVLRAVGHTTRLVSCWSISNDIYQRVSEASCCRRRRVRISCCATHHRCRLSCPCWCYVGLWFKRVMSSGIWISFVFREKEMKKTGLRTFTRFVCFNKLADFHDTVCEGCLDCVFLNSCLYGG